MEINKTILDLAKSYGFDGAEYDGEYGNYKVFVPTFDDPDKETCIGEPIFILFNGKETRIAARFEWREYINQE